MNVTVNLAFGFISDIDPTNGKVKVTFPDETDEGTLEGGSDTPLVSDWIPISTRKSLADKETFPYDVNEHVWCIMDEYLEYGVCCGALFNETDLPDGAGADIYRLLYKDGSYEQFDRSAGNKTLFYKGNFKTSTNAGADFEMTNKVKIANSSESAHDLLKDILTKIQAMTFTNGGGITGAPNNVADFIALGTRVDNLFM
jgi:phage baseplate assembly protein gpV